MNDGGAPESTTAPDTLDTSGTQAGPDGTPGEIDWSKRYNDLRPEFDRTKQELAAAREAAEQWTRFQQNPEEVLTELGYAVEDGDTAEDVLGPEDPYEDPQVTALRRELEQIKQTVGGMTQAQEEAQNMQVIARSLDEQFAALPEGLSERAQDWIAVRASSLPPRADGMPDIASAHAEYEAWRTEEQQSWANTKNAPRRPTPGQQGNHDKRLEDLEGSELSLAMADEIRARMGAFQ